MTEPKFKRLRACACAALFFIPVGQAAVSEAEAERLTTELTPVGATPSANADGSISEWIGAGFWSDKQKSYTRQQLQDLREQDAGNIDDVLGPFSSEPLFVITKANMAEHADKLTAGHIAMLTTYPEYRMPVYKTVRPAFFPDEIYKATKANAVSATLEGTDAVRGASLGFPFPIPGNGAEALWNHKMKFRGTAVRRYNNQAIVKPDGEFVITKLIEDVKFKYANIETPGRAEDNIMLMYLGETLSPPRVAGQLTLVHEPVDQSRFPRTAWIYNRGIRKVRRAPNVGYDNPSIGTDGHQFNDQIDMFNGALDRYTWTLVGKKEIYIPYNATKLNSPTLKYSDIVQPMHINQEHTRYELHRVWVIEANLRDGIRHSFKRRTFYLDEDSWSIAVVDCYDNRDELWKIQEAHLMTVPFIPTTTGIPEIIYDLNSNRVFMTALVNEEQVNDFEIDFDDRYFSSRTLKDKGR